MSVVDENIDKTISDENKTSVTPREIESDIKIEELTKLVNTDISPIEKGIEIRIANIMIGI